LKISLYFGYNRRQLLEVERSSLTLGAYIAHFKSLCSEVEETERDQLNLNRQRAEVVR